MHNYEYSPKGVCSRRVTFDIDEGKLYNVHFEGGCNEIGRASCRERV